MLKKKERSTDRVLVLSPIEGAKVKSSTGLVDQRLFKGGNQLHAIMDTQTCLWSMKYEIGGLPEPLKQKFTSFKGLLEHAQAYFHTRGLEIKEIID